MGSFLSALFGSKKENKNAENEQEYEISDETESMKSMSSAELAADTKPGSGPSESEKDNYIIFLLGELQNVKQAAVDKTREKNDEIYALEEQIRDRDARIAKAQDEIREKNTEIEGKESEIASRDSRIAEMLKAKERDILLAAMKEKEMLAKVDSYKEEQMAQVQEELNKVKVAKYDLYQYLVKIRDTQTNMIADYNKMGMLLKELPQQLDTIIEDEEIKPEIRNLFNADKSRDEKVD